MNLKLAATTLGAALIIAGSPALASAASTQTAPIRIDSVHTFGGSFADNDLGIWPGSVQVAFTNENSSPATDVVFALYNKNYIVDRFDGVGSFAPGVKISHTFAETQVADGQRIAVEKVTFADGTVWNSPDAPAAPEAVAPIGTTAVARL